MSKLSVAIPTFGREDVLLSTITSIVADRSCIGEILVIDQTPCHEPATIEQLSRWDQEESIRWLRLERPSIPVAMNLALHTARHEVVLYLDDDVVPHPELFARHLANYQDSRVSAVVGQVLQPGETPLAGNADLEEHGIWRDLRFRFCGVDRRPVANVIACNLSVRRAAAISAGGFDENFVGVAYRFETEFSRRLIKNGGSVIFDPTASIRHLAAPRGGTRTYGKHLTTSRPEHSVGDYYFALREGSRGEALRYCLHRLIRAACTRFHLTRPWWIPLKLLGEIRGLCWALRLWRRGPKYLQLES